MLKSLITAALISIVPLASQAEGTLVLLVDYSASIEPLDKQLMVSSYKKALSEVYGLKNMHIELVFFAESVATIASGSVDNAITALNSSIPYLGSNTCIADALLYIDSILPSLPEPYILDISGDGEPMCREEGVSDSYFILDKIAEKGTVVNTIIINPKPGTAEIYKNYTRNGGFTMSAANYDDFQEAIFEKISFEISMNE